MPLIITLPGSLFLLMLAFVALVYGLRWLFSRELNEHSAAHILLDPESSHDSIAQASQFLITTYEHLLVDLAAAIQAAADAVPDTPAAEPPRALLRRLQDWLCHQGKSQALNTEQLDHGHLLLAEWFLGHGEPRTAWSHLCDIKSIRTDEYHELRQQAARALAVLTRDEQRRSLGY